MNLQKELAMERQAGTNHQELWPSRQVKWEMVELLRRLTCDLGLKSSILGALLKTECTGPGRSQDLWGRVRGTAIQREGKGSGCTLAS